MLKKRRSRRLRKSLKIFKRKRIDYSKYVKDFYLENGLAYISCNIEDYYDIIDKYSVEGYEWLNSQFAHFLETNAHYIPVEYPIVLEICGECLTDKQQAAVTETIADYYSLKLGDHQLALSDNLRKSMVLLFFGLLLAGVIWLLRSINLIGSIKELILILFWFFTWEFANLAWLERSDLNAVKTEAGQLASIKVVFKETFIDIPADQAEVEQIIAEIIDEENMD